MIATGLILLFLFGPQALTPSILRSYSLMTFSRTTFLNTSLRKWPNSSAIICANAARSMPHEDNHSTT